MKLETKQWDLTKLKSFFTEQEVINKKVDIRLKDNPQNGIKRVKLMQFNYLKKKKKDNNPIRKWTEDLNRHFSKEGMWMTSKHMKRCSILLNIRDMQIKITMSFHLTPVRTVIIKNIYKQ